MKRKRDSTSQRGNEAKVKVEEAKSDDELCPYFDNLPSHLTVKILLQLSIKSLLICKCVCKNWKTMISESHFTKLHFEQAPNCLMIRPAHYTRVGRTMHLLECEPANNHVKLEPIFKLPLRDANSFREKRLNNHNIKRKQKLNNIACNPSNDKFKVVNSCNGLLCLCHPYNDIPLVICNPITGEFIRLPKAKRVEHSHVGFGFHSKTNEYKVIRIWRKKMLDTLILEIHTLGTLLWRNIEADQNSIWNLECPTCVNDTLHWIRHIDRQMSILCFSFESERLQSFPSPTHVFEIRGNIRMGELRGFLYICDISLLDVTLWVMNEYGIGESWTKVYNIDTSTFGPVWRQLGLCFPIKHFKEGAFNSILLLYNSSNCFIYYEPEKNEIKAFQIQGTDSKYIEVISHIPSLISLKDVVKGDNIEVLNIHSRCAKFKLREENEVLSLSQIV